MAHAPAPATKPFYLAEFVQPGRPLLAEVPLSCEPYRVKRCAACRSPNTYRGITCTKCGHSLADPGCVVDERDCPFCVVVRAVPHGLPADGAAIEVLGETVRFADDEILIVDAKFVSAKAPCIGAAYDRQASERVSDRVRVRGERARAHVLPARCADFPSRNFS